MRSIRWSWVLAALCGALMFSAVASAATWPIPQRPSSIVQTAADLRGVLIRWEGGHTFQVDDATWVVSAEGNIGFQTFHGWDESGKRIDYERPNWAGRIATSVSDLGSFRLGNPDFPEKLIQVQSVAFGTNGDGYLIFSSLQGHMQESGQPVSISLDAYTCGNVFQGGCRADLFCSGQCGAQPGCPCNGGIGGACSFYGGPACMGTCPAYYECFNNSNGICGCTLIYIPPPPGGGSTDPKKPKIMQVVPESQ